MSDFSEEDFAGSAQDNVLIDQDIADQGQSAVAERLVDKFYAQAEKAHLHCYVSVTTNPDNGLSVTTYERGAVIVENHDVNPDVSEQLVEGQVTAYDLPDDQIDDDQEQVGAGLTEDGMTVIASCTTPKLF